MIEKLYRYFVLILLLQQLSFTLSNAQSLEYLGQNPPGEEPKLFDPGIFTYELHTTIVFSPDGNEAYWREMGADVKNILYVKKESGTWTSPEAVPFSNPYGTGDPFFLPNGNKLFFTSMQPISGITKRANESIWCVERSGDSWSDPVPLNNLVNSHEMHWQMSVAANGNLYFGQLDDNRDFGDIYVSRFNGTDYTSPVSLGDSINSPDITVTEATPFIAPDESYLIFARSEFSSNPYNDLYISFKKADNSWTTAQSMDCINTPSHELCPIITADGKYLFFLSMRSGLSLPYWVDAQVIEDLRPTTGINDRDKQSPWEFQLFQNYPNPFNPATKIEYSIPHSSKVLIKIYDILGNEIATLVNGQKQIGTYEVEFIAKKLSSGVYLYRMISGDYCKTQKMVLLR